MERQDYVGIRWIYAVGKMLPFLVLLFALVWGMLQLDPDGKRSGLEEEPTVYASTVGTRQTDSGIFGNVTIASQDHVSLAMAIPYINGENCGDFSQGERTVRVYPQDVLTVDASAYQRELCFSILSMSESIDASQLATDVICNGDSQVFGRIEFK